MTEPENRYERGVLDGKTAALLAEHDEHLQKINGSMAEISQRLTDISGQLLRQNEQSAIRETNVVSTAAALAAAETARRVRSDSAWSPVSKLLAVIIAVAALGGLTLAWLTYASIHPTGVHP